MRELETKSFKPIRIKIWRERMNSLIDYFFVIGPSSDGSQPKVLAHLPQSVPWNVIDAHAKANLPSLCLPRGSVPKSWARKPTQKSLANQRLDFFEPIFLTGDEDTKFHSFLLTKEDKQMSWGHSLEFWNPSGGLSHSLVIITTRKVHSPLGGARERFRGSKREAVTNA